MNLQQLPYILAIASSGNLSAASRQLGISQPALSKYLRDLEEEIGMELFFKRKKQYLPTPAGIIYIHGAKQILELMQHTRSAVSEAGLEDPASIRIGVSPNHGIAVISSLYPDFDKRYPHVELAISEGYSSEARKMLLNNELDGMIGTCEEDRQDLFLEIPYFSEELVLAVPSFHLPVSHTAYELSDLPYADLHDFRDSIFIMPKEGSILYKKSRKIFETAGFTPRIITSSPNILIPEAMIRSGLRVGILPSRFVRKDPQIAFFRLRNTERLTIGYICRQEHTFTKPERFLLYLFLRYEMHTAHTILWSDFLRGLLKEFDTIDALGVETRNE